MAFATRLAVFPLPNPWRNQMRKFLPVLFSGLLAGSFSQLAAEFQLQLDTERELRRELQHAELLEQHEDGVEHEERHLVLDQHADCSGIEVAARRASRKERARARSFHLEAL